LPRAFIRKIGKDERGVALIEYSLLIGLVTGAVITIILAVGNWTNSQWAGLDAALQNCGANPNAGDPNSSENAENNAACDSAAANNSN